MRPEERIYEPIVNRLTLEFLKEVVVKGTRILEIGSGRSTIWFSLREAEVIAYENKEEWANTIRKILVEKGLVGTTIICDPLYPTSGFAELEISPKTRMLFDVVFCDGADCHGSRVRAIKWGASYVKRGGYLLADDMQRKVYGEAEEYVDSLGWEKTIFIGEGKRAIVWKKIK